MITWFSLPTTDEEFVTGPQFGMLRLVSCWREKTAGETG